MRRRQFIRGSELLRQSRREEYAPRRGSPSLVSSASTRLRLPRRRSCLRFTEALRKPVTSKAATSPLSTYGQTAPTNASPP